MGDGDGSAIDGLTISTTHPVLRGFEEDILGVSKMAREMMMGDWPTGLFEDSRAHDASGTPICRLSLPLFLVVVWGWWAESVDRVCIWAAAESDEVAQVQLAAIKQANFPLRW